MQGAAHRVKAIVRVPSLQTLAPRAPPAAFRTTAARAGAQVGAAVAAGAVPGGGVLPERGGGVRRGPEGASGVRRGREGAGDAGGHEADGVERLVRAAAAVRRRQAVRGREGDAVRHVDAVGQVRRELG